MKLRAFAPLALAFSLFLCISPFATVAGASSPPGRHIYQAGEGLSYVVLERLADGGLALVETNMSDPFRTPNGRYSEEYKDEAVETTPGLELNVLARYIGPERVESSARDWRIDFSYKFRKSESRPGDYDLVGGPGTYSPVNLKPDPCYLHLIDEERIVTYFHDLRTTETPAIDHDLLDLARKIVAAHPDDLFVRALLYDALIRNNAVDELDRVLEEAKKRVLDSRVPCLWRTYRMAEQQVRGRRLSTSGQNAFTFTEKLVEQADIVTLTRDFPKLFQYEAFATILPNLGPKMNFLAYQIHTKLLRVDSYFALMQGRREDSARELLAGYWLGALMQTDQYPIQQLIGIALRAISCAGLEIHALNACETPTETQALWEQIENLRTRAAGLKAGGTPPPDWFENWDGQSASEKYVRKMTADAKFENMRTALAARDHQLRTGALPRNANELGPLMPQGPPADPYSSEPLKIRAHDSTSAPSAVSCYSIGPDGRDDGATIEYDPTNGTISRGDIITGVPHERSYPFPRAPVTASSAAELCAMFPHGLPPDPFADTRGRGLTITDTVPVRVFSWGPDTNQSAEHNLNPAGVPVQPTGVPIPQSGPSKPLPQIPGSRILIAQPIVPTPYYPEIPYDPTNGLISPGDLFITIPAR